ncbi:MAG: serine/threonine-protein kinase [Bryobacteraceae bacterium]
MPLSHGTRLGPYEIIAPLGAGGMGEVYRARDTKLKREVALKVLPESFASDPQRMARFQREAEVLASLNHPNIAQIYGVAESDNVRALVMELVEGETLKGPLQLDTALHYAGQIADALEAAHGKGITHRDLKPANIMITPAGLVKVLDFGLAAVAHPAPAGDGSISPTLTMAATEAGMIMGTAAYMSPEQARGKTVDRRADIWAFGVVLYEVLTGKRLFEGGTVSDILAAVLRHEPDWEQVPPKVRRLLKLCLEKDPAKRLRDISGVALLLDEPAHAENPRRQWLSVCGRGIRGALVHAARTPACGLAVRFGRAPEYAVHEPIWRYRDFAGWPLCGVRGGVDFGLYTIAMAAPAGLARRSAVGRHGRRQFSILVSGQQVDRVRRQRQAEAGRYCGRRAAGIVRCRARRHRGGRDVEPRWGHPLWKHGRIVSRPGLRGHANCSYKSRRIPPGNGARLSAVPAGREAFSLLHSK